MSTNMENHPAVIRARTAAQKIRRAQAAVPVATLVSSPQEEVDTDSGSETERETPKVTVSRPTGETGEERRARKAGVKAERSVRFVLIQ